MKYIKGLLSFWFLSHTKVLHLLLHSNSIQLFYHDKCMLAFTIWKYLPIISSFVKYLQYFSFFSIYFIVFNIFQIFPFHSKKWLKSAINANTDQMFAFLFVSLDFPYIFISLAV